MPLFVADIACGMTRHHHRQRHFFEVHEADDDVGHLDAGVVDVVLNVDLMAGGAEHADEGVAEDGVAQVADVRGLVGVDAGVLDQDVVSGGGSGGLRPRATSRTAAARSMRALM